jgi:glycosyltransferase involved in cell wall biosynthesis
LKISVACCTYNGERFLRRQIDSILGQSTPPDEIVICDDCSTDDTPRILKEYRAKYGDRIRAVFNDRNIGPIRNFEQAIKMTSGDVVFLSDQDDVWLPEKVKTYVRRFEKDPNARLIFSNGILIDEDDRPLGTTLWDQWPRSRERLKRWRKNRLAFIDLVQNINIATGATMAFRKELKEEMFPFNFPVGFWHDQWMALVASASDSLRFFKAALIQYRVHGRQLIGTEGIALGADPFKSIGHSWVEISYPDFFEYLKKRFPGHELTERPSRWRSKRVMKKLLTILKRIVRLSRQR